MDTKGPNPTYRATGDGMLKNSIEQRWQWAKVNVIVLSSHKKEFDDRAWIHVHIEWKRRRRDVGMTVCVNGIIRPVDIVDLAKSQVSIHRRSADLEQVDTCSERISEDEGRLGDASLRDICREDQ